MLTQAIGLPGLEVSASRIPSASRCATSCSRSRVVRAGKDAAIERVGVRPEILRANLQEVGVDASEKPSRRGHQAPAEPRFLQRLDELRRDLLLTLACVLDVSFRQCGELLLGDTDLEGRMRDVDYWQRLTVGGRGMKNRILHDQPPRPAAPRMASVFVSDG